MRIDPGALGELLEQRTVEAASDTVVDIFDSGLMAQLGIAQAGGRAPVTSVAGLPVEEQSEPFGMARPDGSPTWQSWACRTPALTLLCRGCYRVCAISIIRTWPDGLRRHLSFSSPETALGSGGVEPKLDRACSKSHRRQTSAGAPCCGWRGATESCHERCATLPHERGGMPVGSRAVRTVLSWSDTCNRRLLAIARTPTGGYGRTSRNMEQRPVRNANPTCGLFGALRNP